MELTPSLARLLASNYRRHVRGGLSQDDALRRSIGDLIEDLESLRESDDEKAQASRSFLLQEMR